MNNDPQVHRSPSQKRISKKKQSARPTKAPVETKHPLQGFPLNFVTADGRKLSFDKLNERLNERQMAHNSHNGPQQSLEHTHDQQDLVVVYEKPVNLEKEELRPREEIPYKEIFPGLAIGAPVKLVLHDDASMKKQQQQEPSQIKARSDKAQADNSLASLLFPEAVNGVGHYHHHQQHANGSNLNETRKLPPLPKAKTKPIPDSRFKLLAPGEIATSTTDINSNQVTTIKNNEDSSMMDSFSSISVITNSTTTSRNASPSKSPFALPANSYIRYLDPTDYELNIRVEYDMDEQDKCWLQLINNQRKSEGNAPVTDSFFELIMDRLEKEWFQLTKDLPRPCIPIHNEESVCAICDEDEADSSNAIVFCDGCNLAVHQDCYGIPFVPEGQWLCRKCMLAPDQEIGCVLCPNKGGALKQTTTNQWAHVLCALWIDETSFANTVYMEPISQIDMIPKSRWQLRCYLCKQKTGACIQCDNKFCYVAFHPSCARECKLHMKMSHSTEHDLIASKRYCDRHIPVCLLTLTEQLIDNDYELTQKIFTNLGQSNHKYSREEVDEAVAAFQRKWNVPEKKRKSQKKIVDEDEFDEYPASIADDEEMTSVSIGSKRKSQPSQRPSKKLKKNEAEYEDAESVGSKSTDLVRTSSVASSHAIQGHSQCTHVHSHAHSHTSSFDPLRPRAPALIIRRIMDYTKDKKVADKRNFILETARYWALKRDARRGAPLLRRLHLEPWTGNFNAHKEDEKVAAERMELLIRLRKDLERARMLCDAVKKREKKKLRKADVVNDYLLRVFSPATPIIDEILDQIAELDNKQVFLDPVDIEQFPEYLDWVSNPISIKDIRDKLDKYEYTSLTEFIQDIDLMVENCKTFNPLPSWWYNYAVKYRSRVQPLLDTAMKKWNALSIHPETGILDVPFDYSFFGYGKTDEDWQEELKQLKETRRLLKEQKDAGVLEEAVKSDLGDKANQETAEETSKDTEKLSTPKPMAEEQDEEQVQAKPAPSKKAAKPSIEKESEKPEDETKKKDQTQSESSMQKGRKGGRPRRKGARKESEEVETKVAAEKQSTKGMQTRKKANDISSGKTILDYFKKGDPQSSKEAMKSNAVERDEEPKQQEDEQSAITDETTEEGVPRKQVKGRGRRRRSDNVTVPRPHDLRKRELKIIDASPEPIVTDAQLDQALAKSASMRAMFASIKDRQRHRRLITAFGAPLPSDLTEKQSMDNCPMMWKLIEEIRGPAIWEKYEKTEGKRLSSDATSSGNQNKEIESADNDASSSKRGRGKKKGKEKVTGP